MTDTQPIPAGKATYCVVKHTPDQVKELRQQQAAWVGENAVR